MTNTLDKVRAFKAAAKKAAYKPQKFDLLGTGDLLQRYRSQSIQVGQALASAKIPGPKGLKPRYDQTRMARYYAALRVLTETEAEIYKRLAPQDISPEVSNRPAFIFLAQCRIRGHCATCPKTPIRGQGLNFWTDDKRDPLPLGLMMAHSGANVTRIKEKLKQCQMLCRTCAKQRGARLLINGNVDLRQYHMEIK